MVSSSPLGLGIGWRAELAQAIGRRADLGFVEILAEDFFLCHRIPKSIEELHNRGVHIVPHGVGLSLDRKSTRLNSSHIQKSRMPSSA